MSFRAYPLAWAQNTALRDAAGRWQRRGLLTAAQLSGIEAAYPVDYYRPGSVWLWLVLLVGTGLAMSSAGFAVAVFFSATLNLELPERVSALLAALSCTVLLEVAIRVQKHYRSGVDNALLYGSLGAWALCWLDWADRLTRYHDSPWKTWLVLVPPLALLVLALLRYADPVAAAGAFLLALGLLGDTLTRSSLGRHLLPFAGMTAAGLLLLALRWLPRRAGFVYYRAVYLTLRALGLAVLYLAGNYLVVREGRAELLGSGGPLGAVPLAGLFWLLTFAVPLLYLGLGLHRHDRLLLWLGVLALAFSLFTFRTYHSVLPPAVAATLAGALLLALALAALRYLRQPHHGFTAEADDEARPPVNLESFVQLETAHLTAPPAPGFEFGGGSSGGGGAEGRF